MLVGWESRFKKGENKQTKKKKPDKTPTDDFCTFSLLDLLPAAFGWEGIKAATLTGKWYELLAF